jgi:hypothetical protein
LSGVFYVGDHHWRFDGTSLRRSIQQHFSWQQQVANRNLLQKWVILTAKWQKKQIDKQ